MSQSNHEIIKRQMQQQFLAYNQEHMIRKFQLLNDTEYLYITFTGRSYRVNRGTALVEWSQDEFLHTKEANHHEAMSIYDVLCCSKDHCCLSGNYGPINSAKGKMLFSSLGNGLFARFERYFNENQELLKKACEFLGGRKEEKGDISYRIQVFEFFPVILQFWEADEEFPPKLQLLWDEYTMDFVHYETTYYIADHLLEYIESMIKEWKNERK